MCIRGHPERPGPVPMMKKILLVRRLPRRESHSMAFLSGAVMEPLYSGQATIMASALRIASRRVSASGGMPWASTSGWNIGDVGEVEEGGFGSLFCGVGEHVFEEFEVPGLFSEASAYSEDLHGVPCVVFAVMWFVLIVLSGVIAGGEPPFVPARSSRGSDAGPRCPAPLDPGLRRDDGKGQNSWDGYVYERGWAMRPANDPGVDYRELVRRAYDACAAAYGASRKVEAGIEIRGLLERLGDGASVLDVGCGTGVPIARALVEAGRVVAVHAESSQ